jgi:gamma-glutamylaminecyclotransferase
LADDKAGRLPAASIASTGTASMSTLVFAYGTLKEGFPNFASNQGKRIPGAFLTVQRFPLYLVGPRRVPWLVHSAGQGERVAGQVFEVNDAALDVMDILEGVHASDGYRRVSIEVVDRDKEGAVAFPVLVYLKQPEQFASETISVGPLAEYTLDHAALYIRRNL